MRKFFATLSDVGRKRPRKSEVHGSNDPSRIILEGTSFVRCSSNRLGTVKTIKASRPYSSILEIPSLYPYLSAARWPTTWYANRKCRKYVLIIINHKTRQHYTWAHLHAWYYLFQRLNRQINQPFLSSPPRAPLFIIIIIIYLLTQLIVTSPFAQQRMTVSAFRTVLLRKGREKTQFSRNLPVDRIDSIQIGGKIIKNIGLCIRI